VCEALRSGVNAVPLGQAEAARAIGLPFGGVMTNVVLPQAVRAALPPLASTMIALLKNTTVALSVLVLEAAYALKQVLDDTSGISAKLWPIGTFILVFVVLVELLSFASNRLERRWRIAR
jgi:glutamate transport system permease protein